MSLKISVILPNLNGGGWLAPCLDSLCAQTVQDFEIIVIDNASSDNSIDIIHTYAEKRPMLLVENKANMGFAYAANQGIALSCAPYVLMFNNDAFAHKDMLCRLLAAMEADPQVFAAQCLMRQHKKPHLVDDAGDFVSLFGWAFQRGHGLPVKNYQNSRRIFSACAGAAMYRRSILQAIGPFEEHFFAYLEDVDLGWRANSLGYKNILCAQAVCSHIGSATSAGAGGGRYNDFKSLQSGRNSLLLPYKNMPLFMLVINFPFLLLGYLIKTLVFHLRGFGAPWRQGMGQAFALLPHIKKPRFRFRHLPHLLWVQASLVAGTFSFLFWRIRRFFADIFVNKQEK